MCEELELVTGVISRSLLRIVASLSTMSAKKCLRSCFSCFAPVTNPSSAPPSAVASPQVNASADGTVRQNAPSVPVSPSFSQGTHVASPAPVSQPASSSAQTAVDKENVEIAPSPLVVITNPSPAATLTVESSDQLSSSASPSVAAYSQVNASTASTEGTPIAPTDAVSPSSQGTVITSSALIPTTSQTTASPPSSSTPSSSSSSRLPKESDHAKTVMEAAKAVDKENVDADFSDLINYISELFRFIEEKKRGKKPSPLKAARDYLPGSKNLFKLREVLSEGINVFKDVFPGDSKTIAQGLLKGMGASHMATTGLLAVANILERYETISDNKEACLSLLKEMSILAIHVQQLQKRPALKEGMEASIKEAIVLIVEASMACCTQIDRSKFSRFFSTTVDGVELAKFQKQLTETDTHMQRELGICQYDAINEINMKINEINESRRKRKQPPYPLYLEDAVGIEDPLKQVIERLEMGSDKKAVAVILHGFGGMGKTTLANAVFAQLFKEKTEACKFSFVRLFRNIKEIPNVPVLQKSILFDLKGEEPEEPQSYEEGQDQIKSILEKEEAFIYIDNVLLPEDNREGGPDALTQLLPDNMGNSKKLRLLITSRDKEAAMMTTCIGIKRTFYPIESLPEAKAVELFKQRLDDKDSENQLNVDQINRIVKIGGGIPQLLRVLAGFIIAEGNALENYHTLMKEAKEKTWNGQIGEKIVQYVFAYDKLEDKLKDPFLDICSFFRGWDWKELSDIVGKTELEKLEKRALVTRDVNSMTARVHDVILEVGLKKTEGERFRLTSGTEIEEFLNLEDKDLQKIKGIWASDNRDPLRIPASKLDLMSGSLRVLKLGPSSTVVEGKCEKKFEEMVFFSAVISQLPFDVSKLRGFKNLAHLCYSPEDLENLSQMPSSLRHIEFKLNSPAFEISSNCIQQLSNLRVLRLSNAQFESLTEELGDLGNGLEELSLSSCQCLKKLLASISRLGSLKVLRMDGCSGLTQLPEDLGSLNSLQELYLEGCTSLEALPSKLENLAALQKLVLSCCESLKELPRGLGKLTSLQELHLNDCKSLKDLPSSLEELSSLRLLDLSHCYRIEGLPGGLEKLTSLVELNLYCCGLRSIPANIGELKLNSINFYSTILRRLPDGFCNFSTLTELDMTNCNRLEELPERFGEVTNLRKLMLSCCHSLKKLPESFNQLKYLENLDLSYCLNLEELCKDFDGLSRLRVLSLEGCYKLKKLPWHFHLLPKLEVLDVRNCYKLEGKWIDSMARMETLQILHISGSKLLEQRWEKIKAQKCYQSWSCAVNIKQGLSNEENLLKQFQSKFDSMLTNGEGTPLNISGLPLETLLLVMFDGRQDFDHDFPLRLLEENIDDIQTNFEMVYFGNHWDHFPKKVANRILGHGPANTAAKSLFQKLLSLVKIQTDFDWRLTSTFQMSAEIVSGEKGDKYLSRWEFFEWESYMEEFVVTKCGRYLKLKELAERPRGSPIALLRELFFAGGEEEIPLSFLKKGAETEVGVHELQGKTILLDIRPDGISYDATLKSLMEMYDVEKEKGRLDIEIITIPMVQYNSNVDVSKDFSRKAPWLVLQSPWQLTNATKYFLVEECDGPLRGWDRRYRNIMRIIESNGRIAKYNSPGVLRMVNTWGAEAYPFAEAKWKELIQNEAREMKVMSNSMFLFRHLERLSEQAQEAMHQQKMICMYSCDETEFPGSIKEALTELSKIICIIYIPKFHVRDRADPGILGYLTATMYEWYSTPASSPMSQVEMQRMRCSSLSEQEAIRFWARIYSLYEAKLEIADERLSQMLSRMTDGDENHSWMLIMDENGSLITEGEEFVKRLCKECPNDKAEELIQQLIEGVNDSWKASLFNDDENSFFDDGDSEGDYPIEDDYPDEDAAFNSETASEGDYPEEAASFNLGTTSKGAFPEEDEAGDHPEEDAYLNTDRSE